MNLAFWFDDNVIPKLPSNLQGVVPITLMHGRWIADWLLDDPALAVRGKRLPDSCTPANSIVVLPAYPVQAEASTTEKTCQGYILCFRDTGIDEACMIPAVMTLDWRFVRNVTLDNMIKHWPVQANGYLKCDGLSYQHEFSDPPTDDCHQSRCPATLSQSTVRERHRIGRTRTSQLDIQSFLYIVIE